MNLKDLIKAGCLHAGEELIWNRRVVKATHIALVNGDGTLVTSDGISHRTPSGAAKHLNGNKPVDGWIAWKSKEQGKSLAELRSQIS
jgi:hypothetical protein